MHVLHACGFCNRRYELDSKRTSEQKAMDCEEKHKQAFEPILRDYQYDERCETYPNVKEK